jgi:hypothetical protein
MMVFMSIMTRIISISICYITTYRVSLDAKKNAYRPIIFLTLA